jgi:hypothetical protein
VFRVVQLHQILAAQDLRHEIFYSILVGQVEVQLLAPLVQVPLVQVVMAHQVRVAEGQAHQTALCPQLHVVATVVVALFT